MNFRFKKSERITSLKEIDLLFERGCNSSVQSFPLRAIYQVFDCDADGMAPQIKVLVSVAKKRLHHAVDRNRAKRQVREAFRLNHQDLSVKLKVRNLGLRVAFVWLSQESVDSARVFKAVKGILSSISKRIK